MLKKMLTPPETRGWHIALTLLVFILLLMQMLMYIVPQRGSDLFAVYGYMLTAAAFTLYIFNCRLSGGTELRLMLIYTVWVFATRLLNRDVYLFIDKNLVYSILLSISVFACTVCADKRQREIILKTLSIIIGTWAFALSAAGVFIILTNTYIHIPTENVWITLWLENAHYSLNLLSMHRNGTSVWLMEGAALMIYQFFACRNKLWRLPIVLAFAVDYAAVAMCHSRTTNIAFSLMIGLLAASLVLRRCADRKNIIRLPAAAAALLIMTFAGYKGMDICLSATSAASEKTIPAFEALYNRVERKANPDIFGITIKQSEETETASKETFAELNTPAESAQTAATAEETGVNLSETRDFLNDAKTFTGRTKIWRGGIAAIEERPISLLIGDTTKGAMEPICRLFNLDIGHMHNYLMQVLRITGLPGMLLVAAISVLIIFKGIRLFFARDNSLFKAKLLVVPIAAIMLEQMLESGLFTTADIRILVFYFLAGCMLAEYRDAFKNRKEQEN